jgi:hypothetical protein
MFIFGKKIHFNLNLMKIKSELWEFVLKIQWRLKLNDFKKGPIYSLQLKNMLEFGNETNSESNILVKIKFLCYQFGKTLSDDKW